MHRDETSADDKDSGGCEEGVASNATVVVPSWESGEIVLLSCAAMEILVKVERRTNQKQVIVSLAPVER